MRLEQAGFISSPHINEHCVVSFVFQSLVLSLKLIGTYASHVEFEVCKIAMPFMHSYYNNVRLPKRKVGVKFKKEKRAHYNPGL